MHTMDNTRSADELVEGAKARREALVAEIRVIDGIITAGGFTPQPPLVSLQSATRTQRKLPKRAGGAKPRSKPTGAKRGRPKGSGKRGAEALEIVKGKPGITIPEIAEAMGIKQNYLYRVMPSLAKDGVVRKRGKGWYPA